MDSSGDPSPVGVVGPAEAQGVVPASGATAAAACQMRKAYFGAACISLQPVLLSAIALPATAYVIRTLGPTEYGQWAMATTLVAVTVFLGNLGLRGTFVRAVSRQPEEAPRLLADQLGVRIALSLLAAGVAIVACLLLRYPPIVLSCVTIAAGAMVLTTVATVASDMLQAVHRLYMVAAANMVGGLVLTGASVVAAYWHTGPAGIAASYLLGPAVIGALTLWVVHRQHFPVRMRLDFRRAVRQLRDARHFAAQLLVSSASSNAEALMIPRLVGATSFGFFSAGTLLATRLATIPDGFGNAAYPAMSAAYRHGRPAALRVFGRFMVLTLVLCVAAAAAVTLVAGPVARLLFPGRAEVCEQVMRVTIWSLPLAGVMCIMGHALNALNKDAVQARASLVGAVCHLLVAAALVWRFGLVGACWSVVLRFVVQIAILTPAVVRAFRPALAEDGAAAGPAGVVGQATAV